MLLIDGVFNKLILKIILFNVIQI